MSKKYGYPKYDNKVMEIVTRSGEHSDMLQDVYVIKLDTGERRTFFSESDEQAILLLSGNIEFSWNNEKAMGKRSNVFDEGVYCLHIPSGVSAVITAYESSELLLQATENDKAFEPVFYTPGDCGDVISGENLCRNTCVRLVRTVFDYNNAPYSNMVLGEVITTQGNWSSYIPHHHPQPEVYFYKFDRPQGFGAGFIGDDVFKIKDGSFCAIPGGKTHPQVTAPGYRMYVCWMIRHLEGNPWTDRIDDEDHTWLYDFK